MKIIAVLCALFFSTLACSATANKFVVFGDSLSDNGNLYNYTKKERPASPPYYEGRFSNGPVWVEWLAAHYFPKKPENYLWNYAFGGAGIKENENDGIVYTLKQEIDTYLFSNHGKADKKGVYIIWIGANNYLNLPKQPNETVAAVMNGIDKGVRQLITAGAQNIVLVNLPDLSKLPYARQLKPEQLMALADLSKQHNIQLKKKMTAFQKKYVKIRWVYLDANGLLAEVLKWPSNYGFTNVNGFCLKEAKTDESERENRVLNMVSLMGQSTQQQDGCVGYLFFDKIHPTKEAHHMIAMRTVELLAEAGIVFLR
jgi:phospholipase/lecithinase/hemolysin